MGAVLISCPACGASSTSPPSDELLRCEYCGQVSLIMRRTGFFERALQPTKRSEPKFRDLPLARQPRSRRWWLKVAVPFIGPALIIVAVTYLALSTRWHGEGVPLLVDINGDGVADVLGRTERGFETIRVGAIDGSNGDILWESAPLELRPANALTGTLILHADTVVFAHDNVGNWQGPTLAWRLRSGEPLWRARGIEGRHARVCGAARDLFFAQSRVVLQLRDGRTRQAAQELPCEPVAYDKVEPKVTFGNEAQTGISPLDSMRPYVAVRRRGANDPWALIGRQSKGPDAHWVAMSTSAEAKLPREVELAWSTEVQKDPPIDWHASTGAVSVDAIYSVYWHAADKATYVVANEREGGAVIWRSDVGNVEVSAIGYATERVYVAGHRVLKILDASSGDVLVDVGPL